MPGFSSYDQVGKKEDVANIIYNIAPMMTPFQTMISKGQVKNDLYEWQEDDLARVTDNAQVEGADATFTNRAPTIKRSNRTQILSKEIRVTETADAIDTYGRDKELAYQTMLNGKELRRDLEHALVGKSQDAVAGDSVSVPKRFGNVFGNDAQGNPLVTNRDDNGGVGRAFTEDAILDLHEQMYDEGADPSILMVATKESRTIANFANAVSRNRDIGNTKKVVNVVELYSSPFGDLKVVINRFFQKYRAAGENVPGTNADADNDGIANAEQFAAALLFNPAEWQLATLRPLKRRALAKTGDNNKFQLITEVGLKHTNYKASGVITDIDSTL